MSTTLPRELIELGPVSGDLVTNGYTSVVAYPAGSAAVDPRRWIAEHRQPLQQVLRTCGVILLQRFSTDLEVFTDTVQALGGDPLPYRERSTPRSEVAPNVYTSTEYPPDQAIPMHNENSYTDQWPDLLFFLCQIPADSGGRTPVCDSRRVLRLLPPSVRDRFSGGVVYTRSFRDGIGLSWQETFQTESPQEVERYCHAHGQQVTWTVDGLRMRTARPAWRTEPVTGEDVWFNQANLFHVEALDEEVRTVLQSMYAEEDLPRNAYLGDGSAITRDDLDAISDVYRRASLELPWQAGDVLVVNNMLAAHGREAFTGHRRILVAMT